MNNNYYPHDGDYGDGYDGDSRNNNNRYNDSYRQTNYNPSNQNGYDNGYNENQQYVDGNAYGQGYNGNQGYYNDQYNVPYDDPYANYEDIGNYTNVGRPVERPVVRKRKRHIFRKILIVLLVLVILFVFAVFLAVSTVNFHSIDDEDNIQLLSFLPASGEVNMDISSGGYLNDPKVVNIVLFGEDDKKDGDFGRTDSIILLSIDNKNNKMKLTSLMRDTWVEIPSQTGGDPSYGKLNASYAIGGPKLAVQTIEHNFAIDIDRYAVVDFGGFESIVNALGGVDIELTQEEIDYINWQSYKNKQTDTETEITADPGRVKLNGRQALWFARNRGDSGAGFSGDDWDRTSRQRKLIEAIVAEVKTSNPIQIVAAVFSGGSTITSNLDKGELMTLVFTSPILLSFDMEDYHLPADGYWVYGKSYDGQSIISVTDYAGMMSDFKEFVYGK